MDIQTMRVWVKSAYPGGTWKLKVEAMPDDQIIPVFNSLVKQGRINTASRVDVKPVRHTRYKQHPYSCASCAANLDPNEKCDCGGANAKG